jgi:hypothetical protein
MAEGKKATNTVHNGPRGSAMKSLAGGKLSRLVIVLVLGVGCGGQTAGGSPGTGGGGGSGGRGTRDAGRDSAGGNPTDASASGGARGGAGGSAIGGAAAAGKGGAGGAKGGAGGATGGGGGGAPGGASGGRCTVFQFPQSKPSLEQILFDMDGDGQLDVVSTWSDSSGLHVLIHRQIAPRVFADPVQYDGDSIGAFFQRGMAAGDLDQDGIPDVAMADDYGLVAVMLSGSGTGYSFPPRLRPPASQPAYDIEVADFDADGYGDVVVPVYDTGVSHGIFWGSGKDTFATRTNEKVCSLGTATAVIDANEDGRPDLVVTCYSGGAQVLINQGGRSFTPVLLPGAAQSFGLATGDLNNDGHVDVVVPDRVLQDLVVSLGDGHGGFTIAPGQLVATTSNIATAAMGDLDGDGNADVLVSDVNLTTLAFYKGTGDGQFQAAQNLPMATRSSDHLIIGDIDGDGAADLLIGNGPTIVYGPCP